jgi:hypothetical protein
MGQVATPVFGSNSRKLAHPLVWQYRLEAAVDWVRRRIRRMELDRPATAEVMVRFIMVWR